MDKYEALEICDKCTEWEKQPRECIKIDIEHSKDIEITNLPKCITFTQLTANGAKATDSSDSGRTNDSKTEAEEQQSKEPSKKTTNARDGNPSLEVGNSSPKLSKHTKTIYNFFKKHPDEEYTPKAMARLIHIKANTISHACIRLANKKLIEKAHPENGYYKYTRELPPEDLELLLNLQDVKLHKAVLRQTRYGEDTWRARGDERTVKIHSESNNHYQEVEFLINKISIKILTYPQKRIIIISCTDFPLDSSGVKALWWVLQDRGIKIYGYDVLEWELNKDIPGLKMYGCQCIKMKAFLNLFMRVYNHNGNLRVEVNQKDMHITAETALAIICQRTQYNPAVVHEDLNKNTVAVNKLNTNIHFMRNEKLKKKGKGR